MPTLAVYVSAKRIRACALSALGAAGLLFVTACSGVGIVATSDPYKKLAQAEELTSSGRIFRARQLLDEAAATFMNTGDDKGLAETYRRTAFLIRTHGEDTILGPASANSLQLSVARADESNLYFERAQAIQKQLKDYALVSHLSYNIGLNYALSARPEQACRSFNNSYAAYEAEKARRPEYDPAVPQGINGFKAFIAQVKQEAGCE